MRHASGGFCAAFAVVVVAYLAAPSHKQTASAVAFALGAIVAWHLLEQSFYPENHAARPYGSTNLPLIATYVGGMLGLAVAAM
jgi:hypothetical protein